MRAIDADALKEDLTRFYDNEVTARKLIDEQPTIHPEPHWIPVTENCDCDLMDNEEVLVFQNDGTINGQIRHAMFYDFNGKKKFVAWEEGITIYNVLAYMPLPEPYKPTVPPECEGDCGRCKTSVIEKCKEVTT